MAENTVAWDMSPFCKIMSDGSIQRIVGEDLSPPSDHSQDVAISDHVSARLYLPPNPNPKSKHPIVLYFHGGGFLIGHASSQFVDTWLTTLVNDSNALVVSVEYRLAPENPLPAAYDDAWAALNWAAKASHPWITQHGDLGRLYLAGESAGANIAHNTAMRAASSQLPNGVRVKGIALVQGYFWGSERTPAELAEPKMIEFIDPLWEFVCPSAVNGRDDPRCNPMADVEGLARLGCERVFVSIGGKDSLRDRLRLYCEALKRSGWKGELVVLELEDGTHDYQIFEPQGKNTLKLSKKLAEFFNGE